MDWKIILILVVLAGIVLAIYWYSCPTRENYNIPWRPAKDRYKAPNPGFNYPNGSLFVGCSNSETLVINWVCDYSTTIYHQDDVHFNLTTDIQLSQTSAKSGVIINDNIKPDDADITITTDADHVHYTYIYQANGNIPPGVYTLHLNSFVSRKDKQTNSDVTNGDMVVYQDPVVDVKSITTDYDDFPVGDDITVEWVPGGQSFPQPSISYTVSLTYINGNIVPNTTRDSILGSSYTYPNYKDMGTYKALVQTQNVSCGFITNGVYSEEFTVSEYDVPVPTVIKDNTSCTYVSNLSACDDEILTIRWCVDFADSPYNPTISGDPDFIINVEDVESFTLTDVVENNNPVVNDMYYYSYTFPKGSAPGTYDIDITTGAKYEGRGEKIYSEASDPTTYTVIHYPEGGYAVPDGSITYDRNPPTYKKTNDVMKLTWDAPDTTGIVPVPKFHYNLYIDPSLSGTRSCYVGSNLSATINIIGGGTSMTCSGGGGSEITTSLDLGEHTLAIQCSLVGCQRGHPSPMTYVNFTVVDCLANEDCSGDLICDEYGTCTGCTEDSQCSSGHCADNICVECTEDSQCSSGHCADNICTPCTTNCFKYTYVSDQEVVTDKKCVDPKTTCDPGYSPAEFVGCLTGKNSAHYMTQPVGPNISSYSMCLRLLRTNTGTLTPTTGSSDTYLEQYPYIAVNTCSDGSKPLNCHCGIATADVTGDATRAIKSSGDYNDTQQVCGNDILFDIGSDNSPILIAGGSFTNAVYKNPDYDPDFTPPM
uniref:Uncharacterized protein n=1 Tax=Marseillevirus LCMAC101 TaxID=2506602 RepID=A0A481YQT5_9VIRU|nr:MAG: hypothetical protein LCMAC101_02080 [Marseillevirus LCMAC101]